MDALAYAYVAEDTSRTFDLLRGGVGRICAIVSLQQALARWLATVFGVGGAAGEFLTACIHHWTSELIINCLHIPIHRCRYPSPGAALGPLSITRSG